MKCIEAEWCLRNATASLQVHQAWYMVLFVCGISLVAGKRPRLTLTAVLY